MGNVTHLGNSDQITTANSEMVILTNDKGQPLRMNKRDLAEVIRQVMSEVTIEKNGLFPSRALIGDLGSVKQINFDTYNGEVPIIATQGTASGTSPSGQSSEWFVLWQYSNHTMYKVQIAISFSGNGLYTRNSSNNGVSWRNWIKY